MVIYFDASYNPQILFDLENDVGAIGMFYYIYYLSHVIIFIVYVLLLLRVSLFKY